MCTEFAGRTCTIAEIRGEEPEEPSERQLKHISINAVELDNPGKKLWRKFKVYDEEGCTEEDVLPKVQNFYKSITGKELNGISMPKKNDHGFYQSSDSLGLGVKTTTVFTGFENEKWTNRFLLRKDSLNYARVFVGYDNLENNTEFTFFVKYALLKDIPENRQFLNKYATDSTTDANGDA